MAQFIAKHNGYLPKFKIGGVESTGLVTKGDLVEYEGIKRLWLEPVKGKKEEPEDLDRKAIIAELNKLEIPFYKGAKTEQLAAMLATHKGVLV